MRLDPRAPLVIDTRELGRRPGSERHLTLTAPAPADLGIEVLSVPEGAPVEFGLRLEAVVEGVLVTGTAHAELLGECVRCLEEVRDKIDSDFTELFVYDTDDVAPEDEETSRMVGDLLDLEPVLRDAVVLSLPFQPLCVPDCPGLCPECGARLADDPHQNHHTPIDPRWAVLESISTDEEPKSISTDEEPKSISTDEEPKSISTDEER